MIVRFHLSLPNIADEEAGGKVKGFTEVGTHSLGHWGSIIYDMK